MLFLTRNVSAVKEETYHAAPVAKVSFTPQPQTIIPKFPIPPAAQGTDGVDLDKLALAVAKHETGNCTAKVGAALYNNCHGFRVSNHFLHFEDQSESFEKFKALWAKDYGGMPTLRLATAYVCGWGHLKQYGTVPCSGGNPAGWLASVLKLYNDL